MKPRESGMETREKRRSRSLHLKASGIAIMVSIAIGFSTMTQRIARAADSSPNPTLATIGDYRITQQEVDAKVLRSITSSELFDLRKQALDSMIDDYVIDQAARRAGLTSDQYLDRELKDGVGRKVTEADARKFYDTHKAQIQGQASGRSFEQIKVPLINALQRQQDNQRRQALIAKLRADNHVKVVLEAPRVNVASAGHPWTGGKDARVTIVEFSDFQCPYCRSAESTIKPLREKYRDQMKLVYMDFPLGFHTHAMDAARAAQCADAQNKFWPYHDALFANQSKLTPADLKATAAKLGLNATAFNTCFDKNQPDGTIRQEMAQGQALGITGTPTFFINGRQLTGAQPSEKFEEIINDELARTKQPANQDHARAD